MNADDLFAELRRWHDRIRFAEIVREETKRTVLVPGPASAVKLEAWLVAHGLDDVFAVETSQILPPDTWLIIDEQALEAGAAEASQHYRPTFAKSRSCARCMWPVGAGHSPTCPIYAYTWAAAAVRNPISMIKVIGT